MDDERLIRIRDFIRRYGVSRSAVYRLAAQGKLPILKLGRASRIRVSDAERLVSSLPEKGRRDAR